MLIDVLRMELIQYENRNYNISFRPQSRCSIAMLCIAEYFVARVKHMEDSHNLKEVQQNLLTVSNFGVYIIVMVIDSLLRNIVGTI
jgi:hypothetical protein